MHPYFKHLTFTEVLPAMFTSTLFGLKQAEVGRQSKVNNLQHDSRLLIPKEVSDKPIWNM